MDQMGPRLVYFAVFQAYNQGGQNMQWKLAYWTQIAYL